MTTAEGERMMRRVMQPASRHVLIQHYATLSDGELLALEGAHNSLTPEARTALREEMEKRGLLFDIPPDYPQPDARKTKEQLPREVEYPSAANVIETADDFRRRPTPEVFRDQLEAGARLRDQTTLLRILTLGAVTAVGMIAGAEGRDNPLLLLLFAPALIANLYYSFRLRQFPCPQCGTRVPLAGKLVRCPGCHLQIYPLR